MKRKARRLPAAIASLILAVMILPWTLSLQVFAEDEDGPKDNDIVKYYYNDDKTLRTGIKKIILDPYTYNDVSGNQAGNVNTTYLNNVVKNYLLKNWAKVADNIFSSQGERSNYITDAEYNKQYQKHGSSGTDLPVRADLRALFSSGNADKSSKWGDDAGWKITGLTSTTSMNAIRKAMAQEICNGMNRGVALDSGGPDRILDKSPLGERLSLLKRDEKTDSTRAFYNIYTYVDRSSGTTGMTYHSYGIAFYDFDLTIIADEKLSYITSAEKYLDKDDPLEAASHDETTKVKYKKTKGAAASNYIENNSMEETENSVSLTNSDSYSITTGTETSETYSYSQMIGSDFGIGPGATPFPRWTLKVEFTAEQIFSNVRKTEKTATSTTEQTINTSITIPPQAAVEILQDQGTTDIDFNFDCPVAISFKVAVFSMGGHVSLTAGSGSTMTQGTAGYTQSDYCTIFGGDSQDAGYSANENLYNRGVKNIGINGFDAAYGKTSGRFNNVGGRYSETNEINWADSNMTAAKKKEVEEVAKDVPLAASGSSITLKAKEMSSSVNHIEPLYLLKTVSLNKNLEDEYDMTVGDDFQLSGLTLEGYNKNNAPYYGFEQEDGHWVLCASDGTIQQTSDYVDLKTSTSGRQVVNAKAVNAKADGVQYLKWVLNDDVNGHKSKVESEVVKGKYDCLKEDGWADNDSINHPLIRLNISEKEFEGTVSLNGSYSGYVGDGPRLLTDNGLTPVVEDPSGKEVSRPVTWEAKELKGLSVDEDGHVTFSSPGSYHVRVYTGSTKKKYSNWQEITALAPKKLDQLTISDQGKPKVLESFILGDRDSNIIDLHGLSFEGKDQYENPWPVAASDMTWQVNDKDINGTTFKADKAGSYTIKAVSAGVVSNELTLTVKPERALKELTIESKELTDNGLGIGEDYEVDLSDIKVTAKDQYGDPFNHKKLVNQWVSDDRYSQISDGKKLMGIATGNGSLKLECGLGSSKIVSNTLGFKVYSKPYVEELFYDGEDQILEGNPFRLYNLKLTAKDQNGDLYSLSPAEIASVEWELTDKGTISGSSGNISYDKTSKILTVKEGTLPYGDYGNIILSGVFTNKNKLKVSAAATIEVRQQPILHSLKLERKEGTADLKTGATDLCLDYFVVTGEDQYGESYDLTYNNLSFSSSNEEAFTIIDGSSKLRSRIKAGKPKQKAVITVSTVNKAAKTVISNGVELTVPRVRSLEAIKFTTPPEMLPIETETDIRTFGAVCYDDEGEPYSEEDLAAYPASIKYGFNELDTDSVFNIRKNILGSGTKTGYVTVNANVVNKSTAIYGSNGQTLENGLKIWIGPRVDSFTADKTVLDCDGQKVTFTLEGEWLADGADSGIEIWLEGVNSDLVDTAKAEGDNKKMKAEISLPGNPSDTPQKYFAYYLIGGNKVNAANPIEITVNNHSLSKVEAKKATCSTDGNIEYWQCSNCHKKYADEKGEKVLTSAEVRIKATGHSWDKGEITKAARGSSAGLITYTCKNDAAHKKMAAIPLLLTKMKSPKATAISFSWTKIPMAEGYEIRFARCSGKDTIRSCKLVKTIKDANTLTWSKTKLKMKTPYKGYVKAYRMENGKKKYLASGVQVHCITGNSNATHTNAKKIIPTRKTLTVKTGQTKALPKCLVKKYARKKQLLAHEAKLRYATSDENIATVNSKGKVTAKGKGTCAIYVFANNGVRASVKLKVK